MLEQRPDADMVCRLESFLTELMLISRKYRIQLGDPDEGIEVIDGDTGNLLGLGLALFTTARDQHRLMGYVPVNSILDRSWVE